MPTFSKTRIAPTPSGFLHLGNAFSFILTAAMARRQGASILLRIDDLDKERFRPEYLTDLFDTLAFLGIPWDEGPRNPKDVLDTFSQHNRLHLYEEALSMLHRSGFLFPCACSRSDLASAGMLSGCTGKCQEKKEQPSALKLVDSPDKVMITLFPSLIREAVFPPAMKHLVVRKKDGYPSYHLASVVDDVFFGVDLVVRGADLWDSSLAQIHLSSLLPALQAFTAVTFVHHPLVTNEGQKLSKSAGHGSIQLMREAGLSKEEVYRQAGRFYGLEEEVTSLSEFTAVLDPNQLSWP